MAFDVTDLLFGIGVAIMIFWLTGQNVFWTGIILIILGILWGTTIKKYDDYKTKKEFR